MTGDITITHRLRLLFSLVLLEYLAFVFSGVSFSFLYGNGFFSLEADPVTWIFYILRIPQTITSTHWLGVLLDILIITLLILFIRNPWNNRVAISLFLLTLLYYVTLMGHLVHHNFQFGFCLIFIPFLFRKELNRRFAFEAARYFMLYFYLSAAFLKVMYHSLSDTSHFSHLISGQFTPYFLEGNTGIRTSFNIYLANHPQVTGAMFLASVLLELVPLAGFFTKRWDRLIAILVLLFHTCNWFIMDIAPLGQISFVCLLFLSRELGLPKHRELVL